MAQDPTPPLTPERLAAFQALDLARVPSPSYVIHMGRLEDNCRLLRSVMDRTGCKILLALKGFACFPTFPLIRRYLAGTTASGIHEALLAHEYFGGEVHVYCPAFKEPDIEHLVRFSHTLVFNSVAQWRRFRNQLRGAARRVECGLRVNPEYSEIDTDLYNPCAPCSRLGILRDQLSPDDLDGIDGLHFHALCEQGSDTLERVLDAFEKRFSDLLPRCKWVNFGGGHHITRPDYDLDLLCRLVERFRSKWGVAVYLEPGEAVALHTGALVGTVVDLVQNAGNLAILDVSATTHMPDVLEMPYRPNILGAGQPGEFPHNYRLGGPSCLAGDIVGDYSFKKPLQPGDRLLFLDMAHYTMVKNSTFNGVPLPSIALYHPQGDRYEVVRKFGYEDYRMRLG